MIDKYLWVVKPHNTEIYVYCENWRQSVERVQQIVEEQYGFHIPKSNLSWFPGLDCGIIPYHECIDVY